MSFALPLDALPKTNEVLHRASLDPRLAKKLIEHPRETLKAWGVNVPEGVKLSVDQIDPDDHSQVLYIPPDEISGKLEAIQKDLSERYPNADDEPYVQVQDDWWGVTFILSPKAASDLRTGEAGIAGVASVLSGVLALLPPPLNALALVPAVLAGILTIAATVLTTMDSGRGIFVYAAWPLIWAPPLWICWPR